MFIANPRFVILLSQTVLKTFLNIWKFHTETLKTAKWIDLKVDYLGISANAQNSDLSMRVFVFSNNKISHLWRALYSMVRLTRQATHEEDRAPGNSSAVHEKTNSKLIIRSEEDKEDRRPLYTCFSIVWGSKSRALCSKHKFCHGALLDYSIPPKSLCVVLLFSDSLSRDFHAYPNFGGSVRSQTC